MGDGSDSRWVRFYEETWERWSLAADGLFAEEACLSRALALFDQICSRNELRLVPAPGGSDYTLELVPSGRDEDPVNGIETAIMGYSRGTKVPLTSFVEFNFGKMLASFAHGKRAVVELGAGYGRQLFRLWLNGGPRQASYYGAEGTASGRAFAERFARLACGMNFHAIDFTFSRPNLSYLAAYDDILIFTSWGAICAGPLDGTLFDEVKALPGRVTMVFIEPVGFQVSCDSVQSQSQADGARGVGYNENFFSVLRDACTDGSMEITTILKDAFAPSELVSELFTIIVAEKPAAG